MRIFLMPVNSGEGFAMPKFGQLSVAFICRLKWLKLDHTNAIVNVHDYDYDYEMTTGYFDIINACVVAPEIKPNIHEGKL